jgi:hypothetical protein
MCQYCDEACKQIEFLKKSLFLFSDKDDKSVTDITNVTEKKDINIEKKVEEIWMTAREECVQAEKNMNERRDLRFARGQERMKKIAKESPQFADLINSFVKY